MIVIRCGPTRIVKIERYCVCRSWMNQTGPPRNESAWPMMGQPPATSGGAKSGGAGTERAAGQIAWVNAIMPTAARAKAAAWW